LEFRPQDPGAVCRPFVAETDFFFDQRRNAKLEAVAVVAPPLVRNGLSGRDDHVPAGPCRQVADDRRLNVDGGFHELSLP